MMSHDALLEYRRNLAHSGDARQLNVMLYDLLVERLRRAVRLMPQVEERTKALREALAVLDALQSSVDLSRGGEVARMLDLFYKMLRNGVVQAHAHSSAAELEQQIGHVLSVRGAWMQAPIAAAGGPTAAVAGR